MRNLVMISFCVLAALAFSADGAFIIDAPSGLSTEESSVDDRPSALLSITPEDVLSDSEDDGLPKYKPILEPNSHITKQYSQQEIKSDTGKPCCYIGDVEILLPIVINGTGPLRSKAIRMIMDNAERCEEESDAVDSNEESSTLPSSTAKANYNLGEFAEEINNSENVEAKSASGIEFDHFSVKYNCNLNDFTPLFTTLVSGTKEEKAVVYDTLTRIIKYCNAEKRISGGSYQHCDIANNEKWGLLFQWTVGQYMNRMILAIERIGEENMRKMQYSRQHKSLIEKRL